jgi:hypothetical protein
VHHNSYCKLLIEIFIFAQLITEFLSFTRPKKVSLQLHIRSTNILQSTLTLYKWSLSFRIPDQCLHYTLYNITSNIENYSDLISFTWISNKMLHSFQFKFNFNGVITVLSYGCIIIGFSNPHVQPKLADEVREPCFRGL